MDETTTGDLLQVDVGSLERVPTWIRYMYTSWLWSQVGGAVEVATGCNKFALRWRYSSASSSRSLRGRARRT